MLEDPVYHTILRKKKEERREGCLPFPGALAWRETQIASSRIWTQVTDFIFYDDNRYADCTYLHYNKFLEKLFPYL